MKPNRRPVLETLDEGADKIEERGFAVGVVMQVHFDVSDAQASQFRQRIERGRMVLLRRIKEGVAGQLTGGVGMPSCDFRPREGPALYPFERRAVIRASPPGLEMIRDRDPHALDRRIRLLRDLAQAGSRVSRQPQMQSP